MAKYDEDVVENLVRRPVVRMKNREWWEKWAMIPGLELFDILKKEKKKRKEIVKQMEFQTMSKFGRNK